MELAVSHHFPEPLVLTSKDNGMNHALGILATQLTQIVVDLNRLERKVDKLIVMTEQERQDIKAAFAQIDTATTAAASSLTAIGGIASDIKTGVEALIAKVQSNADAEDIVASAQALVTKSQAITDASAALTPALQAVANEASGATTTAPVPTPVPAPPPVDGGAPQPTDAPPAAPDGSSGKRRL